MIVRGAPAIGVSGAMGVALGIDRSTAATLPELTAEVAGICDLLASTRPTAVNLFWAINRVRSLYDTLAAEPGASIAAIKQAVVAEARRMYDEDIAACKKEWALTAPPCCPSRAPCSPTATLAPWPPAATAPRSASSAPPSNRATRSMSSPMRPAPSCKARASPRGELMKDNIPTTVLCDNMAASLMAQGRIQAVIVGADRIAANGDVANKIGTYGVAILAKEHGIPFFVAAPWPPSTSPPPPAPASPSNSAPPARSLTPTASR